MPCGPVQAFDGIRGLKRPHHRALDANPLVLGSLRDVRSEAGPGLGYPGITP